MHNTPPLNGACLCGSVRVTLTASPLLTLACHCRDCQKLSASAYTITTIFPSEGFSCTGELIKGGLGSNGRAHYYCKSCLTFVFSRVSDANGRVNLRTSVLDQSASFPPFVEIMTAEKMPWANVPAIHSFAQYPATLEEFQSLITEYATWLSSE